MFKKLFLFSLIICFFGFGLTGEQEKQLEIKEIKPPDLQPSLILHCCSPSGCAAQILNGYPHIMWVQMVILTIKNVGGSISDPATAKVEFKNFFVNEDVTKSFQVPSLKPGEYKEFKIVVGLGLLHKAYGVTASVTFNTKKGPKTNTIIQKECYVPPIPR